MKRYILGILIMLLLFTFVFADDDFIVATKFEEQNGEGYWDHMVQLIN